MEPLSFVGPFLINLPLLLAYLIGMGAGAILISRGQRAAGALALIGFALLELHVLLGVIIALSPIYFSPFQIGRWIAGVTFATNLMAAVAICFIVVALIRAAGHLEI
ncbi:MAG TPA: hypothetical protein G4O02_11190 [Caldilineae bacterium]|nr:hypothetical protein [Caldilineae bacterium]